MKNKQYEVIKRCTYADEYTGVTTPRCGPGNRGCTACWEKWDEKHPISKKEAKEIRAAYDEMRDKHRYLVVSSFSTTFNLFYCVDSNSYVMNQMSKSTRFKSIGVAKAVRTALSDGRKGRHALQIWKVKESKSGKTLKFISKT